MIHVCFAIYDKAGHYSKFLGTTICSLFENTNAKVMVHILHDDTLTGDNRDKLIQLVESYNSIVKFYNVDELCAEEIAKIKEFFPNIGVDRHSIATFYRFFILHLLPQEIEKVLYLDADIIVTLDITEFWQIELGDKPFGAVPEFYQISDKDASRKLRKQSIPICREDVVNPEDYFNAGVMFMNLKVLREEQATILAGMKFISEHPQFTFLDQDILNYCFSTVYLKLPLKFNRFVLYAKRENEWTIQEKVYHYAASRICFVMDSRDPFNRLFMKYFMKTPWIDADTKIALSGAIPVRKNYPVTVIIPLYNEEEYIGECLDSLLSQTFQAFEVIVVDDCSTDSSCAIVESYAPRFNGRLKLEHTKKNSGGGGYVPRNIGLKLARGEYIYVLDADDMILSIALETFYSAAILYDADFVYTKSCYFLDAPNDIFLYKDVISRKIPNINTEFTIDDPYKNLTRLLSENGMGEFNTIQTVFCRRDFLLSNRLFFPTIARSGDFLWIVNVYCYVRRFLRISTPLCLRRHYNANSVTRMVREPQEQCLFWFVGFIEFARKLHELKKENDILAENPVYDLTILTRNLLWSLDRTEYARKELDSNELFKVLYSSIAKDFSDSLASVLSFFFSFIDRERKNSEYYFQIFDKFNRYLRARIDVKFMSTEGNFQIFSVSDKKADITNPTWLQNGSIGHQIQSCVGNLEFITKATIDGIIRLDLRGIDIRDPEDKSKRIPYWIDYTKFTVNGAVIFNKLTPVWHDKPYRYKLDVKAGEEIKIEVEWLPHRDDRTDLSVDPTKEQKKNAEMLRKSEALVSELRAALDSEKKAAGKQNALVSELQAALDSEKKAAGKQNALISDLQAALDSEKKAASKQNSLVSELRAALDTEKKVHGDDVELIRKFSDYFTARLDFKLALNGEGDFQIVSVSDEKATVRKARWLPASEIGYSVQSYVGKMEIVGKVTGSGQFNLYLKGMDIRDPKNREKRIPYWIDYTKLIVNGEVVFDKITPVWHDKSYTYTLDIKADEEIKIEVEWLPHSDKQSEEQNVQIAKELAEQKALVSELRADLDSERKSSEEQNALLSELRTALDTEKKCSEEQKALVSELRTALDTEKKSSEEQNALVSELRTALDTEKKSSDERNALVSELRTALDAEKKVHGDDVELIRKFSNYLTARLDFKFALNGEGDFQIVSVSDEKATVRKARWLPASEIGYSVQSYVGKMEIVGKVVGGGQFNLYLKGMDVRDPDNKSKRIPYWIDYTKLTVNGEVILDKPTPVWHDKSYTYTLDIKADEEIKIEVEWLPHSDKQSEEQNVQIAKELAEQKALVSELRAALDTEKKSSEEQNALVSELRAALDNEKKSADKQNALVSELRTALVSELRTALDSEKKVTGDDVDLIRKSSNDCTARLDFKFVLNGEGDFQIVSVSDEKATVRKVTRWLSANEVGYFVQSCVQKIEVIGKIIGSGQFNLNLKGKDVRDPQNKRKRIPCWIDYTKLTVNGEVIFDKITPVWHDKPYNYIFYANADEEIKIEVEWLPHK